MNDKKRGRPRKNTILDKPIKSNPSKEIKNEEKDIILHLPVFMKQKNKNNNNNTKKEIMTNDNDSVNDEIHINNDHEISILTDENESDTETEQEYKYRNLYKKELEDNKKKDQIIKSLQENKSSYNSNVFDSDIQKDLTIHTMNMNLVDNRTNKIIDQKKTNICCWWCTEQFDTIPCFIPDKYYNDIYYVFGCFCSVNCAASYNLNINDYKVMERYALLKQLYNCIKIIGNNILAPPKEILIKYGGIISIDEYRKNFIMCNKSYRITMPPLVHLNYTINEITTEKNDDVSDNFKSNLNNIKKKLPSVKNNLFNTMGIKNKD